MNNESNESLKDHFSSDGLTAKGLRVLLALSFVVTVLSFAVAYCEHKQYSELVGKYEDAVVRISECEASVAELMNNQNRVTETPTTKVPETTEIITTTEVTESVDVSEIKQTTTVSDKTPTEKITTQTTTKATTTAQRETSSTYYVTQSGKKYHVASCSYLSKSKIAITMDRIKAEGYSPCSRCIK